MHQYHDWLAGSPYVLTCASLQQHSPHSYLLVLEEEPAVESLLVVTLEGEDYKQEAGWVQTLVTEVVPVKWVEVLDQVEVEEVLA